jgi:hypothetical protein
MRRKLGGTEARDEELDDQEDSGCTRLLRMYTLPNSFGILFFLLQAQLRARVSLAAMAEHQLILDHRRYAPHVPRTHHLLHVPLLLRAITQNASS